MFDYFTFVCIIQNLNFWYNFTKCVFHKPSLPPLPSQAIPSLTNVPTMFATALTGKTKSTNGRGSRMAGLKVETANLPSTKIATAMSSTTGLTFRATQWTPALISSNTTTPLLFLTQSAAVPTMMTMLATPTIMQIRMVPLTSPSGPLLSPLAQLSHSEVFDPLINDDFSRCSSIMKDI